MTKFFYVSYRNSLLISTAETVKSDYTEKGVEEESLGNSNSYIAGGKNPKVEKFASLSRK